MTIFQPLDPRGTGNTFWKLHLRPPGSSSSHTSWQSETQDHFHVPWQFSVFSLALEGWLLASFVNAFIQESDNFSHCKLHFLQLDLAELNIDTIKKRFGAIFSFSVKIQTFPKKTPDSFKNDLFLFQFAASDSVLVHVTLSMFRNQISFNQLDWMQ